jgi:hypothetical protein
MRTETRIPTAARGTIDDRQPLLVLRQPFRWRGRCSGKKEITQSRSSGPYPLAALHPRKARATVHRLDEEECFMASLLKQEMQKTPPVRYHIPLLDY